MSYCRFSSEDFMCDVYVYDDCLGGTTVHVASTRPVYGAELPPRIDLDETTIDAWLSRARTVEAMLNESGREVIGLPHDGKTYNFATHEETADFLQHLCDIGYNVPKYAIDALRESGE